MRKKKIDEIDGNILSILKNNADMSMEALRELLDIEHGITITRQAVQARVKKLKDEEILKIKGIVNHEKLGKKILAFVLVSFLPGGRYSQRDLAKQIAEIPEVHGVWVISGDWDILLKVRVSSLEDVGNLIIDKIRTLEGVGKTITCACFSAVKEEY
ncbi:MAG: Lrp/AsnC family transcriptional regulator [Candidatus Hermodarchaeota archaeon]